MSHGRFEAVIRTLLLAATIVVITSLAPFSPTLLALAGNRDAAQTTAPAPKTSAPTGKEKGSGSAPVPSPEPADAKLPPPSTLAGTWASEPDEMKLTTPFDESVWGRNAKSVRTVQLVVRSSGEATLTVTRRVVDGKGRTVAASTSIEEAHLALGEPRRGIATRIEYDVTVLKAERRYPDDKGAATSLDGVGVKVVTFTDGDGNLEVRFDTPEGRGSFWEMLRRTRKAGGG
jgi:hypothetical protein